MEPETLCRALEERGIRGPLPVEGGLLWCCTELNRRSDMDRLMEILKEVCGK